MENREVVLNSRQWDIYNLLKERNGEPINLKDICAELDSKYDELLYVGGSTPFCNSFARRLLTKDIQTINRCLTIQKVIISSSSKGVFLASKDNYKEYLDKEKAKILSSLKRYWNKVKKLENDGKERIVFGKEREVIEAFVGEEK